MYGTTLDIMLNHKKFLLANTSAVTTGLSDCYKVANS